MFRSMSGFKAQYHYLTLMVISEFNEWRILLYGPGTSIQGKHQFSEAQAKEHALAIAGKFLHEYRHEELPVLTAVDWAPITHDEWLIWSA